MKLALLSLLLIAAAPAPQAPAPAAGGLPNTLRGTGFFDLAKAPFAPQYPLWSDGSAKQRWIFLPPGTAIDAADPDAWEFPVGTRLWKQFGYAHAVETRFIERLPDRTWRYATYVWNAAGTDAVLAPEEGADVPASGAPEGRYAVPARGDCVACHEGPQVPVLGFGALQLSPDRDPLAPHALASGSLDLGALAARGLLRNLPPQVAARPPRIAAASGVERAALGYLHGNCGHCHNDGALSGVAFTLAHEAARPEASAERVRASLIGHESRFRAPGAYAQQRVVPGNPEASVVVQRMKSAHAMSRMPPLGVRVPDRQGIELVENWIRNLQQTKEK